MTATRGQESLLPRRRFCPGRDCYVPCSAPGVRCSCRPCYCEACRARRARARRRLRVERPVVTYRSPQVQIPLFASRS
jgi:hypothetical protein